MLGEPGAGDLIVNPARRGVLSVGAEMTLGGRDNGTQNAGGGAAGASAIAGFSVMAARRGGRKIEQEEWPTIAARRLAGETLASIARSYGCTAPAIRYILRREAAAATRGAAEASVRPPEGEAGARTEPPAGKGFRRVAGIDAALRERVNSDISAFLVAFDAAFVSDTVENRRALLAATDRLLHAGALTRIALERTPLPRGAGEEPDLS